MEGDSFSRTGVGFPATRMIVISDGDYYLYLFVELVYSWNAIVERTIETQTG